jgi:hypothetical protein
MLENTKAKHKALVDGERYAFSQRLKETLSAVGIKHSATALGREYNMRTPTGPVTFHAVRKWLIGESIPNQDRLRILSEMLGTSANWLRFGAGQRDEKWSKLSERVDGEIVLMVQDAQRLDTASRALLDTLIEKMLKVQTANDAAQT